MVYCKPHLPLPVVTADLLNQHTDTVVTLIDDTVFTLVDDTVITLIDDKVFEGGRVMTLVTIVVTAAVNIIVLDSYSFLLLI